jgi:hypothetical protein
MSFASKNNPAINVKDNMAEDAGKCNVKLLTTAVDKRFWSMTAEDAYYKCEDYYCKSGNLVIQTET